jgi:exopolysaccharide biosynthesis polyprenyl glycosylphosphotransferase
MASHRDHLDSQILWMAVLDAVCLVTGMLAAIMIRLGPGAVGEYLFLNAYGWLYFAGAVIVANYVTGAYGMEIHASRFNVAVHWIFSVLMALLVVSATSYAWLRVFLGRGVLLIAVAVYSVLWLSLRGFVYAFLFRSRFFTYRVAVLGVGPLAGDLLHMVQNELLRPVHRVVAMIDVVANGTRPAVPPRETAEGIPVLAASPEEIAAVIRALGVDVVLIGLDSDEQAVRVYPQLRRLRFEGLAVLSALHAAEVYQGRIPLAAVDERWLTQASMGSATPVAMRLKRILDVIGAVLLLAPAAALGALIAAAVKLSSPRDPVIYSQERVGRFGRVFRIHKFRTMVHGAEGPGGAVWSPPGDPRVTGVGGLLRRCRLDELPQLLNIVRGDMSFVGPRPERPELVADLEKRIPYYRERENVVPGLTGWAQIRHPYGSSVEDAWTKLEYDLYYIQNISLGLDLRILLRTLRIVVFGLERVTR